MINDLLREINALDFDHEAVPIDIPAALIPEHKVVVYNPTLVTPYYLTHEIIHIEEQHHRRLFSFNGNDERNPNERIAEDEAIHRLVKHHLSLNGRYNYLDIMMIYGIPAYLEQSVIREMSNITLYAN